MRVESSSHLHHGSGPVTPGMILNVPGHLHDGRVKCQIIDLKNPCRRLDVERGGLHIDVRSDHRNLAAGCDGDLLASQEFDRVSFIGIRHTSPG